MTKLPRYMKLSEYRVKCFPGKPPSLNTLYKWVEAGDIITRRFGGSIYVDITAEVERTGDPTLDNIISS